MRTVLWSTTLRMAMNTDSVSHTESAITDYIYGTRKIEQEDTRCNSMLSQRRRRWANINDICLVPRVFLDMVKSSLNQCLLFSSGK